MVAGAVVVAAAAVFVAVVVLCLSWLLRRDGAVTFMPPDTCANQHFSNLSALSFDYSKMGCVIFVA